MIRILLAMFSIIWVMSCAKRNRSGVSEVVVEPFDRTNVCDLMRKDQLLTKTKVQRKDRAKAQNLTDLIDHFCGEETFDQLKSRVWISGSSNNLKLTPLLDEAELRVGKLSYAYLAKFPGKNYLVQMQKMGELYCKDFAELLKLTKGKGFSGVKAHQSTMSPRGCEFTETTEALVPYYSSDRTAEVVQESFASGNYQLEVLTAVPSGSAMGDFAAVSISWFEEGDTYMAYLVHASVGNFFTAGLTYGTARSTMETRLKESVEGLEVALEKL